MPTSSSWWDDPAEPEAPPAVEATPTAPADDLKPVAPDRRLTDDEACSAMERAFDELRKKRGI